MKRLLKSASTTCFLCLGRLGANKSYKVQSNYNLQNLYDQNYTPSNIWNANETGFQGSRDK
ncbi:hypothetical protein L7F22_005953, partial [Adiantum nelumboides]|nr:hypothetical protein [Adiantum nelumboides]